MLELFSVLELSSFFRDEGTGSRRKIRAAIINEYSDKRVVISTDVGYRIPEDWKRIFFTKPESRKIK